MARYYFLEVGDWFSARFDLTPNFISQWRIQTAPPPLPSEMFVVILILFRFILEACEKPHMPIL